MNSENSWAWFRVCEPHQCKQDYYRSGNRLTFTLRPRNPTDFCDLSQLVVDSDVECLTLLRDDPRDIAPFEMEHGDKGLLNGLTIPKGVDTLKVIDVVKGGGGSSVESKFRLDYGLKTVIFEHVAFENVMIICRYSPELIKLNLEFAHVGFEGLHSIALHVPRLTELGLRCCDLTHLPHNLGLMFPLLEQLDLSGNSIKTLKDVSFPDTLQCLSMSENKGLSVRDAVFPKGLTQLHIRRCKPLDGFHVIKLPRNLVFFGIDYNNLTWTGRSFSLPASLKSVWAEGNPDMDLRVFNRHMKSRCPPNVCMRYMADESALAMDNSYNHQDAITRFLHNGVLCVDLMRHVRGFLE